MNECKVEDCTKEGSLKGHCRTHYMQIYRNGKVSTYKYHHGMGDTRFYNTWRGMKERSTKKDHALHKYYWDKGVRLYKEWYIFNNFKKDMYKSFLKHVEKHGEKNTTIERIDNSGGYNPDNCKWATNQEQWKNKDNSRLVTFNNRTETLSQWARELGIGPRTLHYRLLNWDFEKAMTLQALDNITRHLFDYK